VGVRIEPAQGEVRVCAVDPEGQTWLVAAASVLSRVALPGVPRLLRLATDSDTDYVSCICLEGAGDYALDQTGPLDPAEVAGLGAALATIVSDLHHLGVFGLDLSAKQVRLDRRGRPVLLGFWHADGPGAPDPDKRASTEDTERLRLMLGSLSVTRRSRALERCLKSRRARIDAATLGRQLAALPGARLPEVNKASQTGPSPQDRAESTAVATQKTNVGVRRLAGPMAALAAIALLLVALDPFGFARVSPASPSRIRTPSLAQQVPCPKVDRGCRSQPVVHGVIRVGLSTFALRMASAPALVVFGRWDCTSQSLPALLELHSHTVWVFSRWPRPGQSTGGRLRARISGANNLGVLPGAAGCDRIMVFGPKRPVVVDPSGP